MQFKIEKEFSITTELLNIYAIQVLSTTGEKLLHLKYKFTEHVFHEQQIRIEKSLGAHHSVKHLTRIIYQQDYFPFSL